MHIFGIPTTRSVDLAHYAELDWFRSVPVPPQSYIPIIGNYLDVLKIDAQQLNVVLSPGGRVVRYEVHSSRNTLHAANVTRTTVTETSYAK